MTPPDVPPASAHTAFASLGLALGAGAAFWGLGFGLAESSFGQLALFMGLGAGLEIAALLVLIAHLKTAGGRRSGKLHGVAGIAPEDLLFLLPPAIWLGHGEGALAVGFLASAAALGFMLVHYRHDLFPGLADDG